LFVETGSEVDRDGRKDSGTCQQIDIKKFGGGHHKAGEDASDIEDKLKAMV